MGEAVGDVHRECFCRRQAGTQVPLSVLRKREVMSRRLFPFEHKNQPIAHGSQFAKRMLTCALIALSLVGVTVLLGTCVYHYVEGQVWIDAVLNSVLIMSGLGLQGEIKTFGGKAFTSVFALLSAFAFYSTLAILFSPVLHRFLHHFHLEANKTDD